MSKSIFTILLSLTFFSACQPLEYNQPIHTILESPIIPNQVPVMLDNQWRLTELVYQGTPRDFNSIDPVLLTFQPGVFSFLAYNGIPYHSDTTKIEDTHEYRLTPGVGTVQGCGDCPESVQEGILDQAVMATNRYEIVGDILILSGLDLSGKQSRLTFVIDNETTKPR